MPLDLKKIVFASALISAVGILLVVISLILQLASLLITSETTHLINQIDTIYEFMLYPLMFCLFFWAGYRAVKKYKFDAIGAGFVAAFSCFVIGAFQLCVVIVLSIVIISRFASGTAFATPESVLAGALFPNTTDMAGVGISSICGVGILVYGMVINFVVGGLGGLFALSRDGN